MKQKIMFGEWLPDQPGVMGAVTDAKNCYPVTNGYAPLKSESDYSANASEDLLIAFGGKYDEATTLFAASASRIYKFDTSTIALSDISATTSGYSAVQSWDVTQFSSKMILANGANKLQAFTLNSAPGTKFADLSASAPVARYVTVVRDFVVAANDGTNTSKVYWSDINDETDWTPASTSQSDFQVLPDGGDITGLAGGEYGLIFLERAIYRMTYTGSPFFFQFDAISRSLGCISNGSIVQYGNLTYFLADDGFYLCDGQSTKNIGSEKVNRWFFSNAVPGEIATGMSTTIDPVNKLIYWKFNNVFGGNTILIYSIELSRWSYGETTASSVSYILTPSVTLEQVDNYSASIDALTIPLDSRVFSGGQLLLAGTSGKKIIVFSGQPKTANIATGDIDIGRSTITLARPILDAGSGDTSRAFIAVASRDNLYEQVTYGSNVLADAENRVSLRSNGDYHRLKMTPQGNTWKTAVGIEVDIVKQGDR